MRADHFEEDEGAYLKERAEAELHRAEAAESEAARRAHYLLAGLYLDRVYFPDSSLPHSENRGWRGNGRY